MIIYNKPLSVSEASKYVKKTEGNEKMMKFVKDFAELSAKDAQELRKKLTNLELMKLKPQDIIKIMEVMPEDQEDLNKIFVDVRLDEDESKKVLETIKEFK